MFFEYTKYTNSMILITDNIDIKMITKSIFTGTGSVMTKLLFTDPVLSTNLVSLSLELLPPTVLEQI